MGLLYILILVFALFVARTLFLKHKKAARKNIPTANSIKKQLIQDMINEQAQEESQTEVQDDYKTELEPIKIKINPQLERHKRNKVLKNRVRNRIAKKSRQINRKVNS